MMILFLTVFWQFLNKKNYGLKSIGSGVLIHFFYRSGDRQHDLKSEKRRAQMGVAR